MSFFTSFAADYWILVKDVKYAFLWFSFLRLVSASGSMLVAYFTGRLIDILRESDPIETRYDIYTNIVSIAVISLSQVFLRFYSKLKLYEIGSFVRRKAKAQAIDLMIRASLKWHHERGTGCKLGALMSGGDHLYNIMHYLANDGFTSLTSIVAGTVSIGLFSPSAKYVMFCICFVITYMAIERWFAAQLLSYERETVSAHENITSHLSEIVSNVATVQSLALDLQVQSRSETLEDCYLAHWRKTREFSNTKGKTIKALGALSFVMFLFMVVDDSIQGAIHLGTLTAIISYFKSVKHGTESLGDSLSGFYQHIVNANRFLKFFRIEDQLISCTHPFPIDWHQIQFKEVSFRYSPEADLVLNNLMNEEQKEARSNCEMGFSSTLALH